MSFIESETTTDFWRRAVLIEANNKTLEQENKNQEASLIWKGLWEV